MMKFNYTWLSIFSILVLTACGPGVVDGPQLVGGTTEEENAIMAGNLWNGSETNRNWQDMTGTVQVRECDGFCGTALLQKVNSDGQAYAGVSLELSKKASGVDLSSKEGLCVSYSSDLDMNVELDLGDSINAALNYDLPSVTFEKSETDLASRCAKWESFKQKFSDAMSGSIASKHLRAIQFMFYGPAGSKSDFNVKSVESKDVVPEEVIESSSSSVEEESSSSEEEVIESSSSEDVVVEDGVAFLWDASLDKTGRVKTGLDDSTNTSGYFYTFIDDGSSTQFIFPPEIEPDAWDNFYGPLIQAYHGIKASVEMDPSESYPYALMGFNITGEKQPPVDITEWKGLCFAYQSTMPFVVDIGLVYEEVPYCPDGGPCWVGDLPAAEELTVLDIPWESFRYAGGLTSIDDGISVNDVLALANSIKFKFEKSGDFFIAKIGSLGQCNE